MFLDSSVIIEGFKNNNKALNILKELAKINVRLFLNDVVINEVIYQLHSKRGFNLKQLREHLLSFSFLEVNEEVLNILFDLIESYNLKPNDALILATCKHYNLKYLISLDEDFKEPCEKEGIILINSVEKLKEVLSV